MKVRPKKHLGQHFLKDEEVARRIVSSLNPALSDVILEVGPGTGVLTRHMLAMDHFKAYDVDEDSIAYLKKAHPEFSDAFVLGDFLKLTEFQKNTAVIGNFPYNVSSPLFFQIWENHQTINQVVCMIQKEVAERIHSNHGNKVYGILSVLMQVYYEVEWVTQVPPQVFDPPPKVDSAVLRLVRNTREKLPVSDGFFKRLVKAAFSTRRKTLRNALKSTGWSLSGVKEIDLSLRAEQLSVESFIVLAQEISHGNSGTI